MKGCVCFSIAPGFLQGPNQSSISPQQQLRFFSLPFSKAGTYLTGSDLFLEGSLGECTRGFRETGLQQYFSNPVISK